MKEKKLAYNWFGSSTHTQQLAWNTWLENDTIFSNYKALKVFFSWINIYYILVLMWYKKVGTKVCSVCIIGENYDENIQFVSSYQKEGGVQKIHISWYIETLLDTKKNYLNLTIE